MGLQGTKLNHAVTLPGLQDLDISIAHSLQ